MDGNSPPTRASSPAPRLPSQSVNERAIAERIATLLSHYWTSADAPEVRQRQMADWLDDLSEFPAHLVAEACQLWRRTETRRPMPGDIRTRCFDLKREAEERNRPKLAYLPAAETSNRTVLAQRFREAEEARESWAKAHGCESFAHAMRLGLQNVAKMQPKEPEEVAEPAPEITAA